VSSAILNEDSDNFTSKNNNRFPSFGTDSSML